MMSLPVSEPLISVCFSSREGKQTLPEGEEEEEEEGERGRGEEGY